ncbi:MoxR family ATPase [Salicibibacter cibarius]|uniref:MoxR family ATPase n=1 Tax=Salicibibacter cibarius TaxID=2743000 RepID=A0A7T6Z825_9BACI|nr:MoxR family ATPase [Salicibibacter cibarius]QQK78417.1 MoxR family ATPase [Salicibibacter cibarius]
MQQLMEKMEQRIYGQEENMRLLTVALLAGGHVLLEGVPGLGKTKMVRTLAELTAGDYRRVQFTPDMMPSDLTGNVIFNMQANQFQTVKGPVFANLLLADEINRTPPKTQSALLEAMEERQVTIQGETYPLPDPFFVIATQNPVESEGTYPLPEAQLDRFLFKLILDYPAQEHEQKMLKGHVPFFQEEDDAYAPVFDWNQLREKRRALLEVKVEDSLYDYMTQIIRATRETGRVQLGASPRAGIAVLMASRALAVMEGRTYITPDDIKFVALPVLRHRIIVTPQVELEGGSSDQIIREIMASITVPR